MSIFRKEFNLVFALLAGLPCVCYGQPYWVRGEITEYHIKSGQVIVELNNTDDARCQGYNWYGDYAITFPDPSQNTRTSLIAAHQVQVLFDHFKNNRRIGLYVSPSTSYFTIQIITYDGG